MTPLLAIIFLFTAITTIGAKEITGVFTSFQSLRWEGDKDSYYKHSPEGPSWVATINWRISSPMQEEDTFILHMPCVFKFTTSQTIVYLQVKTTRYASCSVYSGELLDSFSELKCTLLKTPPRRNVVEGTIKLPFTFNAGGSALSTSLQCSTLFKNGKNTISFNDGNNVFSIETEFKQISNTKPQNIVYAAKVITTQNRMQHYVLAGDCLKGYKSGTLGIEIQSKNGKLDCDSIHAALANSFNDWYYPENALEFTSNIKCDDKSFTWNYQVISPGYKPFIDALVLRLNGNDLRIKYINNYVCSNSLIYLRSKTVAWSTYTNGESISDGFHYDVDEVTKTHIDSTTQVFTQPFDPKKHRTKTIIVHVPVPTTTTTTTYVGVATSYSTISANPGETGTVVVYNPVHVTETTTECYLGDQLLTQVVICDDCATDTEIVWTLCEPEVSDTSKFVSANEEKVDDTSEEIHVSVIAENLFDSTVSGGVHEVTTSEIEDALTTQNSTADNSNIEGGINDSSLTEGSTGDSLNTTVEIDEFSMSTTEDEIDEALETYRSTENTEYNHHSIIYESISAKETTRPLPINATTSVEDLLIDSSTEVEFFIEQSTESYSNYTSLPSPHYKTESNSGESIETGNFNGHGDPDENDGENDNGNKNKVPESEGNSNEGKDSTDGKNPSHGSSNSDSNGNNNSNNSGVGGNNNSSGSGSNDENNSGSNGNNNSDANGNINPDNSDPAGDNNSGSSSNNTTDNLDANDNNITDNSDVEGNITSSNNGNNDSDGSNGNNASDNTNNEGYDGSTSNVPGSNVDYIQAEEDHQDSITGTTILGSSPVATSEFSIYTGDASVSSLSIFLGIAVYLISWFA